MQLGVVELVAVDLVRADLGGGVEDDVVAPVEQDADVADHVAEERLAVGGDHDAVGPVLRHVVRKPVRDVAALPEGIGQGGETLAAQLHRLGNHLSGRIFHAGFRQDDDAVFPGPLAEDPIHEVLVLGFCGTRGLDEVHMAVHELRRLLVERRDDGNEPAGALQDGFQVFRGHRAEDEVVGGQLLLGGDDSRRHVMHMQLDPGPGLFQVPDAHQYAGIEVHVDVVGRPGRVERQQERHLDVRLRLVGDVVEAPADVALDLLDDVLDGLDGALLPAVGLLRRFLRLRCNGLSFRRFRRFRRNGLLRNPEDLAGFEAGGGQAVGGHDVLDGHAELPRDAVERVEPADRIFLIGPGVRLRRRGGLFLRRLFHGLRLDGRSRNGDQEDGVLLQAGLMQGRIGGIDVFHAHLVGLADGIEGLPLLHHVGIVQPPVLPDLFLGDGHRRGDIFLCGGGKGGEAQGRNGEEDSHFHNHTH